MRVNYDRNTDSLTLILQERPVRETDKIGPGVVADFAADGTLIALKVERASLRVDAPGLVEFVDHGLAAAPTYSAAA
ncbi:DUF2283 domain-containing protein [Methylogaea oryzae]|uniref:DUF2283 domain-containing protein n=1 Tax=Methylogaea oryzae TaxID=1295382 RepID=A0A8D4VQV4_9GAMM|nr:DUF2283 domain-containing protein [Methylogaea oryzae]BBL70939.1 hypothetical protein MoryE10_15450 [Methylogaea oryzae]